RQRLVGGYGVCAGLASDLLLAEREVCGGGGGMRLRGVGARGELRLDGRELGGGVGVALRRGQLLSVEIARLRLQRRALTLTRRVATRRTALGRERLDGGGIGNVRGVGGHPARKSRVVRGIHLRG